MLDYFVSILVSDVYLFKLLSYTGLSDGNIGLIASLGTFSNNYIIPQTPLSSGIF